MKTGDLLKHNELLKNKNIVIIGGTTGIGLSAAKAFIANDANIVVVGRNADSVAEAKKILGKNAEVISADATNSDTAINAIDICIENLAALMGCIMLPAAVEEKWEMVLCMN